MDLDLESIALELVANSGSAKSYVMEALQFAREGKYEDAEKSLQEAEESLVEAHKAQTSLIRMESNGDLKREDLGVIMIHAQDHLMTTLLAQDLAKEMIFLYKRIDEKLK